MFNSEDPEDLKEDEHDQHDDNSSEETGSVHGFFSCIYCAVGMHKQCRGTERYKGLTIRCECFDTLH